MKKFILLFFLTSSFTLFSQTLPIDFESDVTSENFVDFDGGAGSVAANPLSAGINTSTKVGKIVRDGGQIWAGSSLMLADNLDFSALGAIAMSVYTTAPIGSLIKLKLEGADDAAFEVDRYTTSTGEWETMTFDFTGQPAIFNDLVFIFDFGILGDGSATSTFYFDDIQQVEGFIDPELEDIDLPIDFESEVTTEHFVDFDGGFASVVSNPQSTGLNESPTVAKIVRDGGALWAGSKLKLVDNINFSTLGAISMSFYTTAPIGTNVKLKLEGDDGANFEVDKLTTVSGEWENMNFDFSGQPEVFDFLVFMFDFGNLGDSSESSTFYFDGIYQTDPSGGGPTLNQIDFPVDFEDETVDYTVTDFGGNASTLVVDPEDESNHVIKTIKTLGAEIWAGTTIGTETGFATYLPFTLEESKMSLRVWSPDAGISIRLKVEDSNDNTHTCETEAVTTLANAWETLVFDFTNEATGTQSLEVGLGMGWTYNEAAIFFNFGVEGAVDKTYYFDDVIFGVNTGDVGITNQTINEVLAYPNPTLDKWVFDANNQNIQAIKIYDVLGKRIFQDDPNTCMFEVDASNWESGIYMSTIMIGTTITNQLLIKK